MDYLSPINSDADIVTKKYVDDRFLSYPTYTATTAPASANMLGVIGTSLTGDTTIASLRSANQLNFPILFPHQVKVTGKISQFAIRTAVALDATSTIKLMIWKANSQGLPSTRLLSTPLEFTNLTGIATYVLSVPNGSLLKDNVFTAGEYLFYGINLNVTVTTGSVKTLTRSTFITPPNIDVGLFNLYYGFAFFNESEMFIDNPFTGKSFTTNQPTTGVVTYTSPSSNLAILATFIP